MHVPGPLRRAVLSAGFLIPLVHGGVFAATASNEVALEFPGDGGAMLMVSRTWKVARFVHAGFMAGGGQINRDFDLDAPGQPTFQASARTLIFPMVGPRVTFVFPVIAVSVGYAAFWATSDLDVDVPGLGKLSGKTSGWGTGFYSPLISLDVYSKKHDVVYGIGLGGFFGTTYPDLVAAGQGAEVRTDENPINTLTFHLKVGWDAGWGGRRSRRENLEDF